MTPKPSKGAHKEIEIEFISSSVLRENQGDEKIQFIIDRIKENKILVIEESLSVIEESKLIEMTMSQIDSKFSGIEVSTLHEKSEIGIREKLIRLLGGTTGGLTVVGPSKLVKEIKKEPHKISILAGK